SAIAYVQRYSLLAITGLAAKDQDDDGRAGGGEWKGITTEQVAELEAEVKRLGADRTGFLRHIRCETFEDIAAANFDAVMATLRAKKSRAGGKGGTTPPRSKSAQRQAPEDRMGKCARLQAAIDRTGVPEGEVFERYKAGDVGDMTDAEIEDAIEWLGRI